jgi:hypothetical protein
VIRRFEQDLATLEEATTHLGEGSAAPAKSPFAEAIASLRASLTQANAALDDARDKLDRSVSVRAPQSTRTP